MSSNPSLCIPRVFPNIDEKRIRRIFNELNLGVIQRVDIVNKATEKGEKFNRVFIHFQEWFTNSNATTAKERLLNGKEIKIVYDDPWFWKVSVYRAPQANHQHHNPQTKPAAAAPRIQFDDSDEEPRPRQKQRPQEPKQRPQEPRQKPAIAPRLPKRTIHYNNNNNNNNKVSAKKTQSDLEDGEIAEK
jgi:hypothetical protein